MYTWSKQNFGFTLIEVLVTIAIIGILATVVMFNVNDSGKQARDTERQADLRALQNAVELYKNKYGRYPEQCAGGADGWSGQPGTNYACTNSDDPYIVGNTGRLFAEFMSKLPIDPKSGTGNYGYVYRTNTNGTVYKIMAMNSVEADTLSYSHEFKSCDIVSNSGGGYPATGANGIHTSGWCSFTAVSSVPELNNTEPTWCKLSAHGGNGRFDKTYGVWGGFEANLSGGNEALKVRNTTTVICR